MESTLSQQEIDEIMDELRIANAQSREIAASPRSNRRRVTRYFPIYKEKREEYDSPSNVIDFPPEAKKFYPPIFNVPIEKVIPGGISKVHILDGDRNIH